jgi:hypothetical protein
MLTRLTNNGLLEEQQLGRMLELKVGATFSDAATGYADSLARWEPIIAQVADLFARMRTSDAEIAASVLFSARQLASGRSEKPSERDVLDEVNRWKQRRRPPLAETEVAGAIRHLNMLGLVDLNVSKDLPVSLDL